jgi:hypothetical protein
LNKPTTKPVIYQDYPGISRQMNVKNYLTPNKLVCISSGSTISKYLFNSKTRAKVMGLDNKIQNTSKYLKNIYIYIPKWEPKSLTFPCIAEWEP